MQCFFNGSVSVLSTALCEVGVDACVSVRFEQGTHMMSCTTRATCTQPPPAPDAGRFHKGQKCRNAEEQWYGKECRLDWACSQINEQSDLDSCCEAK